MFELSIENIDQITSDVRLQDVNFSHLLQELVDHVCCDVENEMSSGLSFDEAYARVKLKIGTDRFREIQKETLYAVDTKYRKMKNMMKISGIAGTTLFGIAALFKIQHWPGAGVMITLGGFILSMLFLPSALGVLWKETHNRKRLFLFIASFLAGLFFITGTLFKIQHWAGAGYLLLLSFLSFLLLLIPALMVAVISDPAKKPHWLAYVSGLSGISMYIAGLFFKIQHWPLATTLMVAGIFAFCLIALPVYTVKTWKDDIYVRPRYLFILIGLIMIVVPGALVNLNLQNTYVGEFVYSESQQQALYKYLYKNNSLLFAKINDSLKYPELNELHSRTNSLIGMIDKLQAEMIRESEGKPGEPAVSAKQLKETDEGLEIQYNFLSSPFDISPVRNFLNEGSSSRIELENALNEYIAFISKFGLGINAPDFSGLVKPSMYMPSTTEKVVLTPALHSLELLKNSILTSEAGMLKYIESDRSNLNLSK